jgi:hypothetical protein
MNTSNDRPEDPPPTSAEEATPTRHQHLWIYQGLCWQDNDKPRFGGGPTTILYYHVYYCQSCAEIKKIKSEFESDSFSSRLMNTLPL